MPVHSRYPAPEPNPSHLVPPDTDRLSWARQAKLDGKIVIGLVGAVVPVELVLAANCVPVTLMARAEDWARNSDPMEDGHEPEVRSLFRQAVDGEFEMCDLMVIPSTSDGYRSLYQYLKEMVRTGRGDRIPPLFLYDFLFGRSTAVRRYSQRVLQGLIERLSVLTGRRNSDTALASAIQTTNLIRAQLRTLGQLRRDQKLSGCEAHHIARLNAFVPQPLYLNTLTSRLEGAQSIQALPRRPRILLIPAVPLYHEYLHAAMEQGGVIVVAEDGEWSASRVAVNIATEIPAVDAIFSYYYNHAVSQRMLRAERESWISQQMQTGDAEAVVFYIPPSDQFFGWRYPALKDLAKQFGLPSLLIRDEALDPSNYTRIKSQVAEFVEKITSSAEALTPPPSGAHG